MMTTKQALALMLLHWPAEDESDPDTPLEPPPHLTVPILHRRLGLSSARAAAILHSLACGDFPVGDLQEPHAYAH